MNKSLTQIISYGVMLKKLIFKTFSDFNSFDLKCIIFSKNTLWEFDPDLLKADIISFIEYTNSLRPKSDLLRSLPFIKEIARTDLLEDVKKVFD